MARLRIRVELSRAGVGVPLGKLASVVEQTQKFLTMLAEDVHINGSRGEWLGFDFANESLNFTAEYSGSVTAAQVREFYAAFDGTTALRRATIAQFAGITASIGEDELIGFGLYGADDATDPGEWRCLSRRDAARIADEIKVLLKATGEQESLPSHLPAVTDAGAMLFRHTREEESTLEERLLRVERRVEQHTAEIHDLRSQSAAAEDSFRNLLSAVENFCDQAAQQIERVTPAALPPAAEPKPKRRWMLYVLAALAGIALLFIVLRMWPARSAPVESPKAAAAATPPAVQPQPQPPPPPERKPMRIEIEASDPAWVALTDADGNSLLTRLIQPGDTRTIEVDHAAKLRTGNAGGLMVKLDGKPLGPLGPKGKIRVVEFSDGAFKVTSPE